MARRTLLPDCERLDRPEVRLVLFHPRSEPPWCRPPQSAENLSIPVGKDAVLGGRFHPCAPDAPTVLFFHGNGEIVADYDPLGPLYNRQGLNFLPVDYRGYGRSSGRPSAAALLQDAPAVLDFARRWLADRGHHGPLMVMGRSLGSAPALELAAEQTEAVDALVVESGFAHTLPLLRLLGADTDLLDLTEADGFGQTEKIALYHKPTLVIHAARDHIIPYADAEALHAASADPDKRLLRIDRANHNDILVHGLDTILNAVADLARRIRP